MKGLGKVLFEVMSYRGYEVGVMREELRGTCRDGVYLGEVRLCITDGVSKVQ